MARLVDPSAAPRPVPGLGGQARATAVKPTGAEGKGLVLVGEALERGSDEIYRAVKIEEDKADTLRAVDAYTKLRERQVDLTLGEANGFTKVRGEAAVTKPLMNDWMRRYEDAETQIAGTLSNDEQRKRFKIRADVGRLQFQEDILRHIGREGEVYAKDVYDARIATEQKNATARWDNPLGVGTSLAGIAAAVNERGDHMNWTKEFRDAVIREEHSKVHASVVTQAIANGRHEYAKAWYDANREDIDTGTARVLAHDVQDATQKQLSSGYRNEFLAGRESIPTLQALEKRVSADGTLDPERQNALLGPILGRIETLEHREEMRKERALRTIEKGVNQLNARTLAGHEPSFDEFAPYIAATKGTELEGEVQRSIQLAAATRDFRLSSQGRQEQMLADLESRARANPASIDYKIIGHLKTIHEQQGKQLLESPVTFAYDQGLANPVQINWATLENQGEQIQARIGQARGMQQSYGTQFMPLMPSEVAEIRARLDGAKPEDKLGWFGKLRSETGADARAYSAIMAQLAPDDPALAQAGEFAGKGRTEPARLILQGQQLLHPPRKSDGSPDQGKLWPMPPETDVRKRFQGMEGDAFAGNGKYRNMAYQSTQAIYAKLSELEGDATGVLNTNRFEKAFNLATGGAESYRGRNLILPYGMEPRAFRQGLNSRIEDIAAGGTLAQGVNASTLRDLPLEQVGDGRYYFRVGAGFLVDKEGRPVTVNFNLEPEEKDQRFRGTMQGAPSRQLAPWERQKPRIENPDGSFSTERTITIESEGRHFNIPTIVGGRERTQDEAIRLWRSGANPETGSFGSRAEAERAAQARSDEIGRKGR